MSGEGGIDVMMTVVGTGGTALAAESNTVFETLPVVDALSEGFTAGSFCDLQEFSFSAGVGASMSSHAKKKEKEDNKKALTDAEGNLNYRGKMESIYSGQNKKSAKRGKAEFVDMQPVEYTRVMDCMSPQLFQSLTTCAPLSSISVVKRKAAGTTNAGACYLRLDFSGVLLTNLEWKEGGHVILETGTFIYRSLTLRYRPQNADGSLGVAIPVQWKMKSAAASSGG